MRLCAVVLAWGLTFAACRQDMHDQPKYKPLAPATFFGDGRSARPIVEGTVPLGALRDDSLLYTGKVDDRPSAELPFPVDRALLERGRNRYDVYCTPCHDRTGGGQGMVVRRGFRRPPSFHTDRLRDAPAGHFFDVITNGFGVMQDYAAEIAARDRWAIVAYVRALQLSGNARPGDAPVEERARLAGAKP